MRSLLKTLSAAVLAAGLSVAGATDVFAFPGEGSAPVAHDAADNLVQEARVFCYSRSTGRFLHWGYCGPRRYVYHRPRVYCYNKWTGRFLHWGSCY